MKKILKHTSSNLCLGQRHAYSSFTKPGLYHDSRTACLITEQSRIRTTYHLMSTSTSDTKKNDDSKAEAKHGKQGSEKEEGTNKDKTSNNIFSEFKQRMKAEVEKNPELKERYENLESFQNVKGRFSDKYAEGVDNFSKSFNELKDNENVKKGFSSFTTMFEKTQAGAKNADSTSTSEKGTSASGSEDESAASQEEKLKEQGRFSNINLEKLSTYLPKSFEKDDTTWNDAFRAVFGLKPLDKIRQREEMIKQRREEMEKAKKAASAEGSSQGPESTVGEEVTEPPIVDPDPAQPREKSLMEVKLEELGEKISVLEKERENVSPVADTPDLKEYKRLNKEIREIKAEIEKISAQLNTTSLVFVAEKKGTWDKFTEGLKDTPLLQNILGFGDRLHKSDTVKTAKNVAEDARNIWETSQNPIVYRLYNVYEGIFKENEYAEAVKEFKRIDPEFNVDQMTKEIEEEIVPKVLTGYLRGQMDQLETLCDGEALNGIKASIKLRMESKRKMDSSILNIDHLTILAMKNVDKVGPIVVVQFMVQQIDCLYDLEGNVVEGKDDKIVAVFYVMALTRKYLEEELRHNFVCREFAVVGTQPYT